MYSNCTEHQPIRSLGPGPRRISPGMTPVSRVDRTRPAAPASPHEIVERAEDYLRAQIGTRVSLSMLCRVVGVSERSLRNAFYRVRGMSPKRCILADRLQDVRRALSSADGGRTTVTGVATYYGFYELGRFARSYRAAFGEAPSETLRGTTPKSAAEQTFANERAR
jgi:transcriptional regulator GlxA family with amidase domain